MKSILWFEFKKITERKVSRVAMIFGILLLLISNIVMIANESISSNDENEGSIVGDLKSRTADESKLTTELSDEFLTDFLCDYQRKTNGEHDWSLIKPYSNLYALIVKNYEDWNTELDWEDLNRIDITDGTKFYERRDEKIETMLNADYSYGNYSAEEKEYWTKMAQKVDIPYKWGSNEIVNITWNSVCNLFFMIFVISICIAPVFAGESYYRTDALVFSAKYGRNKLIFAKVVASFLFTLSYMTICNLPNIFINIGLFGVDGLELPAQLWDTIIPYRLNAAGAIALNFIVIVLMAMLFTGISLLVSAICDNQIAVLSVDMILLCGTIFLPSSKTSGLWNHIWFLFPIQTFDLRTVLKTYNSYQVAGRVFSYVEMIFIAYIAATVICTYIAGRSFVKRQVG